MCLFWFWFRSSQFGQHLALVLNVATLRTGVLQSSDLEDIDNLATFHQLEVCCLLAGDWGGKGEPQDGSRHSAFIQPATLEFRHSLNLTYLTVLLLSLLLYVILEQVAGLDLLIFLIWSLLEAVVTSLKAGSKIYARVFHFHLQWICLHYILDLFGNSWYMLVTARVATMMMMVEWVGLVCSTLNTKVM